MLSPEVWKFSPPLSFNREITGCIKLEENHLPSPLKDFYFSHLVSVVLPNIDELRSITKSFTNDFEYYKADNIALGDLCSEEFINNFIKRGSLTTISINTRIDIDNSVCITPEGILVLVLNKKSYQESGLEGKLSQFSSTKKDKYIVQLNLKDDIILNKKLHQRITRCLNERLQKFNLILSWEPPEENICPSSIAKFLSDLGYNVQLCTPKFDIRTCRDVRMPLISKEKDKLTSDEIVEWLGMFAIDGDISSGSCDSYINTYECPDNTITVKDIAYIEWRGLFTVHQMQRLYNKVTNYLSSFINVPWISFYVQGFSDSPVTLKLQEHQYFTNGDNAFILFLEPSGQYLLYTKTCSNKKTKRKF